METSAILACGSVAAAQTARSGAWHRDNVRLEHVRRVDGSGRAACV